MNLSKLKYLAAGVVLFVMSENTQAQSAVFASNTIIAEETPAVNNSSAVRSAAVPALLTTISKGHIIDAKEMMDNGTDISAVAPDGQTALHYASRMGYIELVRKLINEGADVNARDNQGRTALDVVKETSYKFPREPRVITRMLTEKMGN